MKEALIYRHYRIHTTPLRGEQWLAMIVKLGAKSSLTKDSLTPAVTRIPGEYVSEAEAIDAAKRYINNEEAGRRHEG